MTKKKPRGVLEVILHRPEVRNAFDSTLIQELSAVVRTEAMEDDVRIVVLRGEGAVFCAGGDLNWMKKSLALTKQENLEDTRKLARLFGALNELSKPVIGLIHGAAIGGGVGLVSICDIAIASKETVFSLSEVRLGIVPACIGPFVLAKIGASHARRLFVSAQRFGAPEAYRIGLVHELVEDPAGLEKASDSYVEQMTQCGPKAMGIAKRLVHDLSWPESRKGISDSLEFVAKLLADVRTSEEGQEGVRAFLEKRTPSWNQAQEGK